MTTEEVRVELRALHCLQLAADHRDSPGLYREIDERRADLHIAVLQGIADGDFTDVRYTARITLHATEGDLS